MIEFVTRMQKTHYRPILFALLAAVLYALSAPIAKLLLTRLSAPMMAAMLYLGAGLGMFLLGLFKPKPEKYARELALSKAELPFIIGMILLDIAAPILLMNGLARTSAANASLLNNFEIVATTLIALFIFGEFISLRLWAAIILITAASILLSIQDAGSLHFSVGSLLVLAACVCWGLENNLTRKLSVKDPLQVVVIKGFGSGLGALIIALVLGQSQADLVSMVAALALGFVAYGLSIYFYISAQRNLGAARTSAYYAAAPFFGVMLSFLFFRTSPAPLFLLALAVMLLGTYFTITEKHIHLHVHPAETHTHPHNHSDGHHSHTHDPLPVGEHSHEHTHEAQQHSHDHLPDVHHQHKHSLG